MTGDCSLDNDGVKDLVVVSSKHIDGQKHMVDWSPLDLSRVDDVLVPKLTAQMDRLLRD